MPARRFFLSVFSIVFSSGVTITPVLAATSQTHIETYTTGNSNTSVSVANESSSKIQTDIVVETNGEVQEYHSDTGEDVAIVSEDGNTVVKVNNSGSQQSQTGPSSTPKPSTPPQSSNTPVPTSPTPRDTASEQQMSQSPDQSLFAAFLHWLINLF